MGRKKVDGEMDIRMGERQMGVGEMVLSPCGNGFGGSSHTGILLYVGLLGLDMQSVSILRNHW